MVEPAELLTGQIPFQGGNAGSIPVGRASHKNFLHGVP